MNAENASRPIAVVGSGSIGTAWAVVFARAGHDVVVFDTDAERLVAAGREFAAVLARLEDAGLLADVQGCLGRVRFEGDLQSTVATAMHVQECAPESLELKRSIFADLDPLVPADATLASSSSAITCSSFAEDLPGRARCLVAHPANPPYLLPVVELVPAPFTSSEAVDAVRELMYGAGMSVVALHREIEGFVYNRLQGALLREAYCLVRDGVVEPEDVDTIVHDGLGRRWSVLGPFETAHLNTRGGIEAHARKLGPAYERMGAERGQYDRWTPELVKRVSSSLEQRLPLEEWGDWVAWRDRALMTLQRTRETQPEVFERG